jgi:hypothetical protein
MHVWMSLSMGQNEQWRFVLASLGLDYVRTRQLKVLEWYIHKGG